MKCPICNRKGHYAVCPRCGYHLENDFVYNNMLVGLTSKEIKKYKKSIDKQKAIYNELIALSKTKKTRK